MVFSHGNQGFHEQSFFLTEHLARHGYVVAACDHVGNNLHTYDQARFVANALDRPRDLGTMIDALAAWAIDPAHPLFGRVDASRVAVIGHSFGGYTTFAIAGAPVDMVAMRADCEAAGEAQWKGLRSFCPDIVASDMAAAQACHPCDLSDPRVVVGVPMAPAFPLFFAAGGVASVPLPIPRTRPGLRQRPDARVLVLDPRPQGLLPGHGRRPVQGDAPHPAARADAVSDGARQHEAAGGVHQRLVDEDRRAHVEDRAVGRAAVRGHPQEADDGSVVDPRLAALGDADGQQPAVGQGHERRSREEGVGQVVGDARGQDVRLARGVGTGHGIVIHIPRDVAAARHVQASRVVGGGLAARTGRFRVKPGMTLIS